MADAPVTAAATSDQRPTREVADNDDQQTDAERFCTDDRLHRLTWLRAAWAAAISVYGTMTSLMTCSE